MTEANDRVSLGDLSPSAEQSLALRAALLDVGPAWTAFEEWLRCVDLDAEIDPDTFRILPLVYWNLRERGVGHPLMARLKGIYRFSWCQNTRLFDLTRPVVAALNEAGIETMLIKGVPLAFQHYRNPALRPMSDLDIVVRPDKAAFAVDVLQRLGFHATVPVIPDLFEFRHAVQMVDGVSEVDLHWQPLLDLVGTDGYRIFRDTARPFDFGGVQTLVPDPTHELILTVLHGLRWNLTVPIRWMADAVTLLRNAGNEIDWPVLVRFARDQRLVHRLRLGLVYIHEQFAAPVPADVLAELETFGSTLVERIENTVVLRELRPVYSHPLGNFWIMYASYCRYGWRRNVFSFVNGFPHYLRFKWELRGRSEIPLMVLRGVGKRLRVR